MEQCGLYSMTIADVPITQKKLQLNEWWKVKDIFAIAEFPHWLLSNFPFGDVMMTSANGEWIGNGMTCFCFVGWKLFWKKNMVHLFCMSSKVRPVLEVWSQDPTFKSHKLLLALCDWENSHLTYTISLVHWTCLLRSANAVFGWCQANRKYDLGTR